MKNSATNDEWKSVESFLLPLHFLHLISAQVTVDTAKKMLRSNDDDDEQGESDTDVQSVFDLLEDMAENSPDTWDELARSGLVVPIFKKRRSEEFRQL